jgi:hypothetical protein
MLQVPRQQLIQVDLLDKLPMGTADLQVPAGGLTVPHIRTGAHCFCSELVVLNPFAVGSRCLSWWGMRRYNSFTICHHCQSCKQVAVKQHQVRYRKHLLPCEACPRCILVLDVELHLLFTFVEVRCPTCFCVLQLSRCMFTCLS